MRHEKDTSLKSSLPTWSDGDSIASLLDKFETALKLNEESAEHWARLLHLQLSGKAHAACISNVTAHYCQDCSSKYLWGYCSSRSLYLVEPQV